jgi:hypothetical protein
MPPPKYSARYPGARQTVPVLVLTVGGAAGAFFLVAKSTGTGLEVLLLETGWFLVIAILGAAVCDRVLLSFCDRRAQLRAPDGAKTIHLWFAHRESRVDRIAIVLSIGALLYSVALGTFFIVRFFDAVIHRIVKILVNL